jgi:prepilin-type N-terminal cleavage/methylation domain-containing protein
MTFRLRSKKCYRADGGFTLIEVLVSLMIMALIAGVAFAGLSAGLDSWQRGSRKIQEMDRRVSVERLFKRQLSVAARGQFQGDTTNLQFVSPYSLANGPTDLMAVKYSFNSGNLSYTELPLAKYTAEYSDAGLAQSLGGFTRVQFAYLGRDLLGQLAWLNEWTSESLPAVVRVQVDDDVMIVRMVNRP